MTTNLPFIATDMLDRAEAQIKRNLYVENIRSMTVEDQMANLRKQEDLANQFYAAVHPPNPSLQEIAIDGLQGFGVWLAILCSIFYGEEEFMWAKARNGWGGLDYDKMSDEDKEKVHTASAMLRDENHPDQQLSLNEFGKKYLGEEGFATVIQTVLDIEGGFNDGNEPRGASAMYGINSEANPDLADKIRSGTLTVGEAVQRYKQNYWDIINWDAVGGAKNVPAGVAFVVFDASVNHGPGFANRILKEAYNLHKDDPAKMVDSLFDMREREYARLIDKSPETYAKYEQSWNNRLSHLREQISETAPASTTDQGVMVASHKPATTTIIGSAT